MDVVEQWSDFFVATAGAAAALAGLIIVAMSVNIKTILDIPGMTSRAAGTIASLILVVVSASAGLIPQQGLAWLGLEILVLSAGTLVLVIANGIKMVRLTDPAYRRSTFIKALIGIVQVLPIVGGSVLLLFGSESGLYWVAAGVILVIIVSVANAWVLLVEILR